MNTTYDRQTKALSRLAHEHACGNIFITALAIRANADIADKEADRHYGTPEYDQMQKAVASMYESYGNISQMFLLHVEQSWHKYYRGLGFWQRWGKKAERVQWECDEYTRLYAEAKKAVNAALEGEAL